ncbi:hypothetical protein LZL87_006588 [Fusarium oxysporum]|nr:hypothetical protein LZL87_006588 [Fusarium oxysporum]
MAEALGVVSSVIAVVDLSAKVFSLCLQYSREVKNAKDDIKRLRVEVATFQVTTKKLQILVEGPRGKELSASQQLKSAIEDGRSRLEKLEQQLQPPTHRKVMSRFGARALKWPFECKDVEGTIQNLVRCRENISLALNIDQTVILQNVDDRTTLSQLPAADGASFDSHAEEHNPTCLPNTREELLREIDHWINDPNSKIMFWLNGKAGTGKSTISRTVARSRCKQGDLGASFFFKRGEVDRGNLSKFVSTVARRLAWSTPVVAPFIKSAVNADPAITDKAVREQFEKLVREPLSKATVKLLSRPSVVIVVDALDECEKDTDIKLLLELFSTLCFAGPLRVRVLVTSRPELPIRLGFSSIGNTHQDLILHKIPLPIIEHDISVFLHHEFANIRNSFNKDAVEELKLPVDWPGEAKLEELTRAAVPLFIFAATLCRFISDPYLGSPDELLQSVLDVAGTGQGSKLDMTYSPVLRQQVLNRSGSERLDIIESFRLIVGSIVTLANPLSMRALALLLDVHVSKTQGDPELSDENEAYGFLTTHFLHWLEALSLMGRVKECLDSLRSLARWLKTREDSRLSTFVADAIRFVQAYFSVIAEAPLQIYCCLAFAPRKSIIRRTFENVIPKWISNLPKVEENWDACLLTLEGHIRAVNSVVFSHDSKRVASGSDDETIRIWDAETGECEQELKGHSGMVTSVAFSHDSKKVASGSDDEMIRIWDAETGECERELKGHSGMVTSVVFSHDSKRVASASSDKAIRIWNAETGECERVLKSHSSLVNSVVFSHDSKKVASASRDEIIRIWDAETGECERELKGHSDWVNSVVFSHDSKKVASGSDDEMIRIWDAETGKCERELKGHSRIVTSVVFSHDSKKVASASRDKTIRIWNAETGECKEIVPLDGYARVSSFPTDRRGIVTNRGVFALSGGSLPHAEPAMLQQSSEAPMLACADGTWITTAGEDLLWLPPECRSGEVAVSGSTVVVGCQSGRVLVLGISMAEVEQ